MYRKNKFNPVVVTGVIAGVVLGACTYDPPVAGNSGGAGGAPASSSTSSTTGGIGGSSSSGDVSASSSGDVISSSTSSSSSSSTSSGDPGTSSSSSSSSGSNSSGSSSSSGFGELGVNCGGITCKSGLESCCEISGSLTCTDLMNCENSPVFFCDGKEDCSGLFCCLTGTSATCDPKCQIGTAICNDDTDCPMGTLCDPGVHGTIGECN